MALRALDCPFRKLIFNAYPLRIVMTLQFPNVSNGRDSSHQVEHQVLPRSGTSATCIQIPTHFSSIILVLITTRSNLIAKREAPTG